MKSPQVLVAATVPALLALSLTAAPGFAGTHHAKARAHVRETTFAFKSSGFGTRIVGGQLPAGSETTGYKAIGCTNKSGRSRTNDVAQATLPGLGQASGIKTHVWTTSRHGTVAAHSLHRIARVTLVQSALGSLALNAITSRATASHDASGFHANTTTHVGGLSFTPPIGPAQTFPLPTPDQPLTIPGLATIYAGRHVTHQNANGATADAYALRVDVIPTGTSVRLGHSRAILANGMTGGVFSGRSAATHVVTALGDIVQSGPNPLAVMPCQGTYGKVHEKSLASVDLGGQLIVKGANARERGTQHGTHAWGFSRSEIARVNLGDQLVIDGIVGKASVTRDGKKVKVSDKGTQLGTVTVAGQVQTFPQTGTLEIPGVAKLERDVVSKSHSGIRVVSLRITLLDGSGAVINLGEASLKIGKLSS
ncbi:MAG: choice-of-anchor P family protein [Nocardioides sp.]